MIDPVRVEDPVIQGQPELGNNIFILILRFIGSFYYLEPIVVP